MSGLRILLTSVLAGFLALTAVAIVQHGYVGFFELALANWATRVLAADLVISLSLILWWMGADAKRRGASLVPFVLVTLTLGAAGPLLYLIRRGETA